MATDWQLIETASGSFLERFADRDTVPPTLRVIRDEWDTETDAPRRTIHEAELV